MIKITNYKDVESLLERIQCRSRQSSCVGDTPGEVNQSVKGLKEKLRRCPQDANQRGNLRRRSEAIMAIEDVISFLPSKASCNRNIRSSWGYSRNVTEIFVTIKGERPPPTERDDLLLISNSEIKEKFGDAKYYVWLKPAF